MLRIAVAIVVGLFTLLSGCSLWRTPDVRPSAPLPMAFDHGTADARASVRTEQWWQDFNDVSLDVLVDLAIVRNPDLAAAAVRVRRANLQARLTGNTLLPIASGNLTTGVS